jgi:septal ring factor EnvC (AmiA/AmiB activator)
MANVSSAPGRRKTMRPNLKPFLFVLLTVCAIILCISGDVRSEESLEQQIQTEKKKLEQIQKEIAEKKKASQKTARQEKAVKTEMKELESKLTAQKTKIRSMNLQLGKMGTEIRNVQEGVHLLENRMDTRKDDIRIFLRRAGITASASTSTGFPPVPRSDTIDRMAEEFYFRKLALTGYETWADMASKKGETENHLSQLKGKYKGLSRNQIALLRQKNEAERAGEQKKIMLTRIQNKRADYEASIKGLQKASARVQDLLSSYEKSRKSSVETGFAREKGHLPWPMDGDVVTGFGSQKDPDFGIVVERKGIEIAAVVEKNVHAVHDGIVVYADFLKGHGSTVILDHGGKYYSIYAHATQILVSKGSSVKEGQVIARVTLPDSVREESEATLYFEIRHGAGPENPLAWLKPRKP